MDWRQGRRTSTAQQGMERRRGTWLRGPRRREKTPPQGRQRARRWQGRLSRKWGRDGGVQHGGGGAGTKGRGGGWGACAGEGVVLLRRRANKRNYPTTTANPTTANPTTAHTTRTANGAHRTWTAPRRAWGRTGWRWRRWRQRERRRAPARRTSSAAQLRTRRAPRELSPCGLGGGGGSAFSQRLRLQCVWTKGDMQVSCARSASVRRRGVRACVRVRVRACACARARVCCKERAVAQRL